MFPHFSEIIEGARPSALEHRSSARAYFPKFLYGLSALDGLAFAGVSDKSIRGKFHAQLLLNLLERHTLGLRDHRRNPDELQHHHPGKK